MHVAAWEWFRDHDQPEEAVRHALLAGESAAAADLVQQVARPMQVRGDMRKLVALIRLLPVADIQARIGLRLWMVHLHLYALEFEACAAGIARLKDDIPQTDTYSRYRLQLLKRPWRCSGTTPMHSSPCFRNCSIFPPARTA